MEVFDHKAQDTLYIRTTPEGDCIELLVSDSTIEAYGPLECRAGDEMLSLGLLNLYWRDN